MLEPKKTQTILLFLCRLRTVGIVRFPPSFSSSADKITTLVNKITHDWYSTTTAITLTQLTTTTRCQTYRRDVADARAHARE